MSIASRFGNGPAPVEAEAKDVQHIDAMNRGTGLNPIDKQGGVRTTADVKTARALATVAGLDWRADSIPLQLQDGRKVESHVGITRSDTGALIGVVGKDYGIIQPEDMIQLADAVLEADGYTKGNAGVLRGGSRGFLQLRSQVRSVGGVDTRSNITIFNSWDGSLRFEAGFADTVIVCKNTLAMALAEASTGITIRHTSSAPDRVQQATRVIQAAKKYTGALDNAMLKMMALPLSTDNLMGLLQTLLPADADGKVSARTEKARQSILAAYTKAPGAAPGVAWGAMQAVSYYATHEYPVRKTSGRTEAEARAEGTWWGPGNSLMRSASAILASREKVQQLVYVSQR